MVDQPALYEALKNKTIARAAIDVTDPEPIPMSDPLLTLDNVVITPHMAGPGEESSQRAADFAYYNIAKLLSGEEAESLVTPE